MQCRLFSVSCAAYGSSKASSARHFPSIGSYLCSCVGTGLGPFPGIGPHCGTSQFRAHRAPKDRQPDNHILIRSTHNHGQSSPGTGNGVGIRATNTGWLCTSIVPGPGR